MSSAKTINSSLGAQGQASAPLLFPRSSVTPPAGKGLQDDPQESRSPLSAPSSSSVVEDSGAGAAEACSSEDGCASALSTVPISSRLSPLSRHKYYDSPGKQLLFDFIAEFLNAFVIGFQPGHGSIPDQILFNDGDSTLCVPVAVMLLDQEEARSIVKAKIIEKRRAFLFAPISFEEARVEGIAWG